MDDSVKVEIIRMAVVTAISIIEIGVILWLYSPTFQAWAKTQWEGFRWDRYMSRWRNSPPWFREAWYVRGRSPIE